MRKIKKVLLVLFGLIVALGIGLCVYIFHLKPRYEGEIQLKSLQKDLPQASLYFKKAVEMDPENANARYNLSLASIEEGKKAPYALQLLNEVRQLTSASSLLNEIATDLILEVNRNRDIF